MVTAGGWLMLPILLCSIVAVGICAERLVTLNPTKISPPHLLARVWTQLKNNEMDAGKLRTLRASSPLGNILAAGLGNAHLGREAMKSSIEEAASHVIHDLERYLNTLGTIAAVTPLLGLMGTVVGMIGAFQTIEAEGTFVTTGQLAGDIWEALLTTAAGLSVAIPAAAFYNFLHGRVESLILDMEKAGAEIVHYLRTHRVERPASPAPPPPGDLPPDSDMSDRPESRTQPRPPTPS
jgi:biopolymer transport protein ExbB